jgi:hypothetical protein
MATSVIAREVLPTIEPDADTAHQATRATKSERRARRPDHQAFDEVIIHTVPRYKTSSLSGNMWRTSTTVEFRRKGRAFWEEGIDRLVKGIDDLSHIVRKRKFADACMKLDTSDLCDQEGCGEPWTRTYKMKLEYTEDGMHSTDTSEFSTLPTVRKFCERHSKRGDCAREDNDTNYEEIVPSGAPKPADPAVRAEDERPAIFLGVIG